MGKPQLRIIAPNTDIGTLPPRRIPNAKLRPREHLTEDEVDRLMHAARNGKGRYRHRDATMILIAFRHGLRPSELVDLVWDDVDFKTATLFVRRLKGSDDTTHPILGDEMRALRKLPRTGPFAFTSERGGPMSAAGFAKLIARLGVAAGFEFRVHPHMLRHACGYALANKGIDTRTLQGYLGHRNIQHTVRYTNLSPGRFKNIWSKS